MGGCLALAAGSGDGLMGVSGRCSYELGQEGWLLCIKHGIRSEMKLRRGEGSGLEIGEMLIACCSAATLRGLVASERRCW